jgi:iron complex transport system ATP-binding protein
MNLRANSLSIGYKGALVSSISFDIETPSLIALTGDNGIGKSTFLKTLCGLIKPQSGEVLYDDKNIQSLSAAEISRAAIYLSGSKKIFEGLTIRELMALAENKPTLLFSYELSSAQSALIKSFGLEQYTDTRVSMLSDGQYQLAAIAFAISRGVDFIFLDEPFSFLDYKNKKIIFNLLRSLVNEQNKTIIFSTHDYTYLKQCDKIWLIEDKAMRECQFGDLMI